MRLLVFLFIIYIAISGIKSKCSSLLPNCKDPHAGYAKGCCYDGKNEIKTQKETCKRKKEKKGEFLRIVKGKCPKNIPKCT